MTGREMIEAAFSPDGTRDIPAVICYEGIYFRDHWEQLTACPWWYVHDPDLDRQMQWLTEVHESIGQDWFHVPVFYSAEDRRSLSIDVRDEGAFLTDKRTGEETRLEKPQVGGWSAAREVASHHPGRLASTPDEIDAAVPIPEDDAGTVAADGRGDLASRMLEVFAGRMLPMNGVTSPVWGCYGLWGFEGMMTMVADRPDLVEHVCRRHLARELQQVRRAAAVGARAMWVEECMTDMVGPEAFARLCVPFVRELTDAIRDAGMKSIYYYCGNPVGKWDLILAIGADALSLEESKKGFEIDIEDVVNRVDGRSAVLGNLDAIHLLPQASEEDLRREIARQIAAGRRNGSRFIMSIGSPVTPETPVERVRLYCDLVHELGKG
ncbi:MAG TPA: uroporphyrinogen decarboxylase family protein [Planctomycetota bacterium]|nr:uroporphyrinogen decarboxylase family protein [Planctomycetota bacterium]